MNRCPKCGKMFEGSFCPECGRSLTGERLCPNCKKKVPSTAKFCAECGFTLTPQAQPKVKKKSPLDWIKEHKKLIGFGVFVLILIVILAIAIPSVVANRHNGTYYRYENEQYNYDEYFILKGDKYTDESGYSCDVKFDGDNVTLYADLLGIKGEFARGTIKDGVLTLNILGAVVTYAKQGAMHENEFGQTPSTELSYEIRKGNYTVTGLGSVTDTKIVIPSLYSGKPVTSIGEGAFQGCSELTSVTIGSDVTSIGKNAFAGCSGLTSIDIPDNVTSIGKSAFAGCSGLREIKIPFVGNRDDTHFYSLFGDQASAVPKPLKKVTITGGSSIGNEAFHGCRGLTSINIPDSVTSIGDGAFAWCSGLTSIDIPDSVTAIGKSVFYGCQGLTSIDIPDSVTSIGMQAFFNCSGLTSVTIPNSVTLIEDDAFACCSRLTSITIPDSVTSIGLWAFEYCSMLKKVYFENPNGWSAGFVAISGLDDPATAAEYLTSFDYYCGYYWKRG